MNTSVKIAGKNLKLYGPWARQMMPSLASPVGVIIQDVYHLSATLKVVKRQLLEVHLHPADLVPVEVAPAVVINI
jgi:hypothetical protein